MASEPADGAEPVLEDEDVPEDEPEIAAELLCWLGWEPLSPWTFGVPEDEPEIAPELLCWLGWEPLSPWTFGWVLAPESSLTSGLNVLESRPLTSVWND